MAGPRKPFNIPLAFDKDFGGAITTTGVIRGLQPAVQADMFNYLKSQWSIAAKYERSLLSVGFPEFQKAKNELLLYQGGRRLQAAQAAQLLLETYALPKRFIFVPDDSDVLQDLAKMDLRTRKDIFERVAPQLREAAKSTLIQTFMNAIERQVTGAWPFQYTKQLIDRLNRITTTNAGPIKISAVGLELVVLLTSLEEILGSFSDLEAGYHRGALIHTGEEEFSKTLSPPNPFERNVKSGRGAEATDYWNKRFGVSTEAERLGAQREETNYPTARIRLPYKGEPLRYTVSRRYRYWRAVFVGANYYTTAGKAVRRIPIEEGAWEQTIADRINLWESMGKSPQWLLLMYGTRWTPKIAPYPIIEEFYARFSDIFYGILAQELNTAFGSAGFEYYARPWGSIQKVYRVPAGGHVGISHGGQFASWANLGG